MQQTVLTYGDPNTNDPFTVQITNCLTRTFEQEVVTDPSGTDTEYIRTRITVEGWLRVSGSSGGGIEQGVRLIPNNYVALAEQRTFVERILSTPRLTLRYGFTSDSEQRLVDEDGDVVDGATIFYQALPPNSGQICTEDLANGPRCEKWNISSFAGGKIAKIAATFVGCRIECTDCDANDSRVLSNRWSVRDSIDHDWYTTRTYSGRLTVTSAKVDPNRFRKFCLPLLPYGMRRQSMDFEVATDGKTLNYTIVDKEVAFAAPAPATSWEVSHREETSDSTMERGSIRATLKGHRFSNKKELFAIGVAIIENKLLSTEKNQKKAIINHIAFTDVISTEQPVTVMIECDVQHSREGNAANLYVPAIRLGKPIDAQAFTKLPWLQGENNTYNSNESREPVNQEGDNISAPISILSAVHAYFQSSCSSEHAINIYQDLSGKSPVSPSQESANPLSFSLRAREVPDVPETPLPWSSAQHNEAAYTDYRVQSTWTTNHSRVHLPIAKVSGAYLRNNGSSSSGSGSEESSDSPDTVTISFGAPSTTRRIRIHAERIGQPPSLPRPDDIYGLAFGNKTATLLEKKVVLQEPEITVGGEEVFVVDAQYDYAINRHHKASDDLMIGINPSRKGAASYFPGVAQNTNSENEPIA